MSTRAIQAQNIRPGDIITIGPTRTLFDRYATETVSTVIHHGTFVDIYGDAGRIGPNGADPTLTVYVRR